MSDQRPDDTYTDSFDDTSSDANERANLSPDLLPIHDRLSGDGVRWRRRAPDGARLGDWARATLVAAPDDDATMGHAPGRARLSERRLELDAERQPTYGPKGPLYDMTMTRIRGFAGAAAAIVVVGLIALLLTRAANRGRTGAGSAATPTPPPTPSGSSDQQPGQFQQPDQLPVAAPGDQQIVYKIANGALLRSSDGGKTWASEALPKTELTKVDSMSVAVSPLDPNHIFVAMGGQNSNQPCSPPNSPYPTIAMHGGILASGYVPCAYQYLSVDGGHAWTTPTLPSKGVLGGLNMMRGVQGPYGDQSYAIQAQGSRLYAAMAFDNMSGSLVDSPGARLVASDDGGQTWRFVDRGLAASNRYICDFRVDPASTVVYAVTGDSACGSEGSYPHLSLWRSDSGGQSWARVRALPEPAGASGSNPSQSAETGLVVGPHGELYTFLPQITVAGKGASVQSSPADVVVSLDGGATFTSAPSAGLPANPMLTGPFAVLSDGSVVFSVSAPSAQGASPTSNIGFLYIWKRGAASWTKISPAYPAGIAAVTVSPVNAASADQLVTVITDDGRLSTLTARLGQ